MPKRSTESTPPGWAVLCKGLADIIEQSGLSVATVASRAGISRQFLYRMMKGKENPTIRQIDKAFRAAGVSLDRWLSDRMLYGRDKPFHDRVQKILEERGPKAIALRVVAGDEDLEE